MNIETANRLLQYRKSSKLSQEELAEKIGVSRQAVSKWERAEASPDTDNLIMLAKVYGVTLDELLNQQVENTANQEDESSKEINEDKTSVSFKGGIHVKDKDGTNVDISFKNGVHVDTNDGTHVHIGKGEYTVEDVKNNVHKHKSFSFKDFLLFIPYPIIVTILFFAWGISGLFGGFSTAWMSFLTIPIYYSIIDSITKRNATHFAFPVLATLVFLVLGMYCGLWHPGWIVFLLIPAYYGVVESINKARGKDKAVNVEFKDI